MTCERKPSPAMPRVRVHRLVATEFWEVLAWYASLSPLVADHFADCFDAAMDRVTQRPTTHAPWQSAFRRVRLKRFPYLLIFNVDHRAISILALVHEKREPKRMLADMRFRQAEFSR